MTRLERKQAELEKLYRCRAAAMCRNDFMWMEMNSAKIAKVEAEIEEMKQYEPRRLAELMVDFTPEEKNVIFKALLRTSLVADLLVDAAFRAREALRKSGLADSTYSGKVREIEKLAQELASIPIGVGDVLSDFILDNDGFIERGIELADERLADILKL